MESKKHGNKGRDKKEKGTAKNVKRKEGREKRKIKEKEKKKAWK